MILWFYLENAPCVVGLCSPLEQSRKPELVIASLQMGTGQPQEDSGCLVEEGPARRCSLVAGSLKGQQGCSGLSLSSGALWHASPLPSSRAEPCPCSSQRAKVSCRSPSSPHHTYLLLPSALSTRLSAWFLLGLLEGLGAPWTLAFRPVEVPLLCAAHSIQCI